MSVNTAIEWTDSTWNPIRGVHGRHHCTKISPGCQNCYAAAMNKRFSGLDYVKGADTFRLDEKALSLPLRWKDPRRIFVCSMTDLFHEDLDDSVIAQVFMVMNEATRHTFQVLTKRPERMLAFFQECAPRNWTPLPNVWLGVTVESPEYVWRIEKLLQTPAAVRFVSYEPALAAVDFKPWLGSWTGKGSGLPAPLSTALEALPDIHGLDWLICGGESGPKARPCDLEHLESVVNQCDAAGVPVFVKQLGAVPMIREDRWKAGELAWLLAAKNKDKVPAGYVPLKLESKKGSDPEEWPVTLKRREFPREAA